MVELEELGCSAGPHNTVLESHWALHFAAKAAYRLNDTGVSHPPDSLQRNGRRLLDQRRARGRGRQAALVSLLARAILKENRCPLFPIALQHILKETIEVILDGLYVEALRLRAEGQDCPFSGPPG